MAMCINFLHGRNSGLRVCQVQVGIRQAPSRLFDIYFPDPVGPFCKRGLFCT